MTEEQRQEITRLLVGMPYLGTQFVPLQAGDPVDSIITNLANLQDNLTYTASRAEDREKELKEAREFINAVRLVGKVLNAN